MSSSKKQVEIPIEARKDDIRKEYFKNTEKE
jgi:hypothetical protein